MGVGGQKLSQPRKSFLTQLWAFAGLVLGTQITTGHTVPSGPSGHISLRRKEGHLGPFLPWSLTPGCLRPRPGPVQLCTPHPHHSHSLVPHSTLGFAEGERTQAELGDDRVGSAPDSCGTGPGNHLCSGRAYDGVSCRIVWLPWASVISIFSKTKTSAWRPVHIEARGRQGLWGTSQRLS